MFELTVWLAAAGGALCAALVVWRAPGLGGWLGVMDLPDGRRKTHARATPLVGGIAVALPVLAALAAAAALHPLEPFFAVLGGATLAALLLGLVDDRRSVSPSLRLLLSALVCAAVLWAVPDLQVSFFHFSFVAPALFLENGAALFTVVCLIGLQNAINMADGRNGIVLGLALIWTALLLARAPAALLPMLATLAGALAVTFAANLQGRLFLGDSGTYALAMLFGLVAIHSHNVGFERLHSDTVALMFLVPVADCLRVMFARLARGRSPFTPDRGHLHHLLNDLWPWRVGLPVYLALVGVPVAASAFRPGLALPMALAALACYTLILAAAGRASASRRGQPA